MDGNLYTLSRRNLSYPSVPAAVEGNTVRFTIAASFGDNDLQLSYGGVVDSTGARMEGDVSVMGFGSGFKGTKQ